MNQPNLCPRLPEEINIISVRKQGKNGTSKDFVVRRLAALPIDGELSDIQTVEYQANTVHISNNGPAPDQTDPGEMEGNTHSSVILPDPHIDIRKKVEDIVSEVVGPIHGDVTINKKETSGSDVDLSDRSKLFEALQQNTHIVTKYFDLRTNDYFYDVISPTFGVATYWYRQEFAKSRGMVHWHGLCWRSDKKPHNVINECIEKGLSDKECAATLSDLASIHFGLTGSHPAGQDENDLSIKNYALIPEVTAPLPPDDKNPLIKLLMEGWRANRYISLIVLKIDADNQSVNDILATEKYVCGYACKGNQPTGVVVDLFNDLVNCADEYTGATPNGKVPVLTGCNIQASWPLDENYCRTMLLHTPNWRLLDVKIDNLSWVHQMESFLQTDVCPNFVKADIEKARKHISDDNQEDDISSEQCEQPERMELKEIGLVDYNKPRPDDSLPDAVMVEFHSYTGPAFIEHNTKLVPIVPVERKTAAAIFVEENKSPKNLVGLVLFTNAKE
ncbi:unnamed protein product [Mytilus coruscus]|uniref:Helitron helicase-like domain-containing protein n=1 Tax=Mytilus coruscus TaxID=42192 RepID=A0A6J8AXJ4_MYTCO|nr:unnamed protein product [Mytilus coruscus]